MKLAALMCAGLIAVASGCGSGDDESAPDVAEPIVESVGATESSGTSAPVATTAATATTASDAVDTSGAATSTTDAATTTDAANTTTAPAAETSAGSLWLIANEGLLAQFDLTEESIAANSVTFDPAANTSTREGQGLEPTGFLDLGSPPVAVSSFEGTIWVATYNEVRAVDIASGTVLGQAASGVNGEFYDVAVDAAGVWLATHEDGVARVDPATVTLVAEPSFGFSTNGRPEIAVGEGFVWAGTFNHLYQIDPATATEVRRIPEAPGEEVAFGEGAVWVGHSIDNTISRVDPASGAVITLTLDSAPEEVAAGAGAAWAAIEDANAVAKIDPATNQVISMIAFPFPTELVVANGYLWVANQGGTIGRIDPTTDSVEMFYVAADPTVVGIAVT